MLFVERNWNMWIPGFGMEDLKPYKKASATEAHKQVSQYTHTFISVISRIQRGHTQHIHVARKGTFCHGKTILGRFSQYHTVIVIVNTCCLYFKLFNKAYMQYVYYHEFCNIYSLLYLNKKQRKKGIMQLHVQRSQRKPIGAFSSAMLVCFRFNTIYRGQL